MGLHYGRGMMLIKSLFALALAGTVASGALAQSQDMNNMAPTNDSMQSTETKSMSHKTMTHSSKPMHHNMRHHSMNNKHCHWMMRHGKKMRMCGTHMKHHTKHHTMKATMTTTKSN